MASREFQRQTYGVQGSHPISVQDSHPINIETVQHSSGTSPNNAVPHAVHYGADNFNSNTRSPSDGHRGNTNTRTAQAPSNPCTVQNDSHSPNDRYATIADRLLALRASQESNASNDISRHDRTQVSTSNGVPTNFRRPSINEHTSRPPPAQRDPRDKDRDQSDRSPREQRTTPQGKPQQANRAIRVFVAVLFVAGVPMLVVGIVLISLANRPDSFYHAGLVLLILAAVVLLAASVLSVVVRCGLCKQNTHTIIQVHRANQTHTLAPGKKEAGSVYRPQPAPGYHTPLPFGPTLPGYIPPQVVFSKYAKKAFNHRAIIAGSDTPVSDDGTDSMPPGFPAYPMKSPRLASTGVADPIAATYSPEQGTSSQPSASYLDRVA